MRKIEEYFTRYTAHAHMLGDVPLFNMQMRNIKLYLSSSIAYRFFS